MSATSDVFKFSDVASNYIERISPGPGDEMHYIGLEHISPDSLYVKEWGSKTELIGEKIEMRKGDILFARRNAYLKRVGIAPFDGIFSAHGLVLRPNEKVISHDLFPFLIKSDVFMKRAINISVGSLSPTVNWKDLKNESFTIPDLCDQKKYSDILWKFEDLIEFYRNRIIIADELIKSRFIEMFGNLNTNSKHWEMKTISDVAKVPLHYGSTASAIDYDSDVRYVRITDIGSDGKLNDDFKSPSEYNSRYLLNKGDILFARSGSVGVTYLFDEKYKSIFAGYLIRFVPNTEKIDPGFAYQYTKSEYCQGILTGSKRGGVQKNVNAKQLSAIPIPVPPMNLQKEFTDFVRRVDKSKFELQQHIENTKKLQKTIINSIFRDV